MFHALIKLDSKEDGASYFSPVAASQDSSKAVVVPTVGSKALAYASIDDLQTQANGQEHTIARLLAPQPSPTLPIYCVGLNYRSHAKEASLKIPNCPPLWTKPAASLADPNEAIPVNSYCATSLLDFEGELVFVTAKECKDVDVNTARKNILGYTVGNDLSCRFYQLQNNSAGQFFYAKAFDKFAPIGPALLSAEAYDATAAGRRLRTTVNGRKVQNVEIAQDMIFDPAKTPSHMSQGTTIPAGTAVMTGTAAGVGAFQSPKSFLQDGDIVEIPVDGIGTLRNEIKFEK